MKKKKTKATKASGQWIKASGETVEVTAAGEQWTLKELQDKVGGLIEFVGRTNLNPSDMMLANEEGILLNLPFNRKASLIAGGQPIVGDVIIVSRKDMN